MEAKQDFRLGLNVSEHGSVYLLRGKDKELNMVRFVNSKGEVSDEELDDIRQKVIRRGANTDVVTSIWLSDEAMDGLVSLYFTRQLKEMYGDDFDPMALRLKGYRLEFDYDGPELPDTEGLWKNPMIKLGKDDGDDRPPATPKPSSGITRG